MRSEAAVRCAALSVYALCTLFSFPHALSGSDALDLGLGLAWFGPAALIVGIAGQRPARAMGFAFLASLASHAVLFHWFYIVTVRYGEMPSWIGFFAPLVPALYVSLFTALFAWLWTRMGSTSRRPILVGAILWVAVDWARGHFLGGFPWATLGYALHLDWPLLAWSKWAGVYVLSFFAAAVGIALGRLWLQRSSTALRGLGVSLVLVTIAHFVGVATSPGDFGANSIVRVAAVQGNIEQGEKWNQARRERIFETYLRLSREAAEKGATWIVWPETAVPGLIEVEPRYSARLGDLAREYKISLIVGGTGVSVDPVSRGFTDFFDSAFLFDATGTQRDRYDKTHLVPFGEFVPLRNLFGQFFKSLARGLSNSDITAGLAPRTLVIDALEGSEQVRGAGLRVGVVICYELLFPDLVRRFGREGAAVLLAMTNDAWYGRTGAPHQFLAISAVRAAENSRWMVRSANTGISAVIDASGRVRRSTPLFEEALIVADIPVATDLQPTFYARFGDVFAGICVVVSMLLLGRQEMMLRRRRTQ
jgi:apolipoprotein N-acyltransferase